MSYQDEIRDLENEFTMATGHHLGSHRRYVVIELAGVIRHLSQREFNYRLYRYFPLQCIIEMVLSTPTDADLDEVLWDELYNRAKAFSFDNTTDIATSSDGFFDFDNLVVSGIFEEIAYEVDAHMSRVMYKKDPEVYFFEKWLDSTRVLLRVDIHAEFSKWLTFDHLPIEVTAAL